MNTVIRNGRLIDPANGIDQVGDIYFNDTIISVANNEAPANFTVEKEVDANGALVIPGLVDLACRLREPGSSHKGNIASETFAAVANGVTTVCLPPDTSPVIESTAVVEQIQLKAELAANSRVLCVGALTQGLGGELPTQMWALKNAGCVAVSNAMAPIRSTLQLRRALQYAVDQELTVVMYADDQDLSDGGCAHEGTIATRLGLSGIPAAAETVGLARIMAMVKDTGARVHVARISSHHTVDMLRQAQAFGVEITADVAMHQLVYIDESLVGFNPNLHVYPPFRTIEDRDALRAAVADGTISAIVSDHQPHDADAKLAPFPVTEPGISALDTFLSCGLQLVNDGVFDLSTLLNRVTAGPSDIFSLSTGRLSVGAPADITIVDIDSQRTLRSSAMVSQGKNSPWLNQTLPGNVSMTFVGGNVVFSR